MNIRLVQLNQINRLNLDCKFEALYKSCLVPILRFKIIQKSSRMLYPIKR